jgi:diguanylate cyclase (GGDEF)-like protein
LIPNDQSLDNLSKKELIDLIREYRELEGIDELTGIWGRVKISAEMSREISRTARYLASFSAIIFDIDEFKKINDACGFKTGNSILQKIAGLVNHIIRDTDRAGRTGGNEFLILLPGTTEEDAYTLAERIRSRIEETDFTSGSEAACPVTASFGVVECVPSETEDEVMKRLVAALFDAKKSGKNKVKVH